MKRNYAQFLVIDSYMWTTCPECDHQFLLTKNNLLIMDRDELPPSIRSALPEIEFVENHAQAHQKGLHRQSNQTQNCNSSIQSSESSQPQTKASEVDDDIGDINQQRQDIQEDL